MPMTAEKYRQKYQNDPAFRERERERGRAYHRARGAKPRLPAQPRRASVPRQDPVTRFWSQVNVADGCWLWAGHVRENGYAAFGSSSAHRFSYELHKGPIPAPLQIDHLCRVRHCVNPNHLEAVTVRENLLRGNTRAASNAAKTACKMGHPYTRIYSYISKRNGRPYTMRICRECQSAGSHRLRQPAVLPPKGKADAEFFSNSRGVHGS